MNNIDELKNQNAQLILENNEAFDLLKKLNQKLKEADAFKSHFLSNISNEIINPFTSILGLSQNILSLGKQDIEQIHSMANHIYAEAFDLDFQLRNIFAAAKIESGENNLELVNIQIKDFVEEILGILSLKAERNSLYFELNYSLDNETFVCDAGKLKMILINLIMNAITFSEPKNKIGIYLESKKDGFKFSITNTGKIISPENSKLIFDRFTKLDTSINSINQGHGLGLSIIKDYVELLEGEISLISNKKSGTTFGIKLPRLKSKEGDLFIDNEDIFMDSESDLF